MTYSKSFIDNCTETLNQINTDSIEKSVQLLLKTRENAGRLFIIGSGGGAGHASHAACDFRKLCNIESYAPYDNISELTARVNDEGWENTITGWLKVSKIQKNDCLLVFSVGGGSLEHNISMNLVNGVKLARENNATVI